MRIDWSDTAFEDLRDIQAYIAKDSPYYAEQFVIRILTAADKLVDFPERGRRVPEAEELEIPIRELIYQGYRIMYQYQPSQMRILIVAVVHGSRNIDGQDPKPWEII